LHQVAGTQVFDGAGCQGAIGTGGADGRAGDEAGLELHRRPKAADAADEVDPAGEDVDVAGRI
jgi:hypothetical protein